MVADESSTSVVEGAALPDRDAVYVRDVRLVKREGGPELTASVDGDEIRFRFPHSVPVEERAEAFIGPAMFEAMVRNVPVIVDDSAPLSRALQLRLHEVQRVFSTWNEQLAVVPVVASRMDDPVGTEDVLACFSGGIDSTYTYALEREHITQLLLIEGFASGRGGRHDWERNVAARSRFASAEGQKLIAVESNVCGWLAKRKLSLLLTHGAILCSVAATLRPSRFLIPASYTADDLTAWGSHPLVDPLWSTPASEVVHHGFTASRTEKTRVICSDQRLLDQLQVCWFAGSRNCGRCSKCIRTAVTLHLLGARSASLPPYTDVSQLKHMKPSDLAHFPYLLEIARLADEMDRHEIADTLYRYARHFRLWHALGQLTRELGGEGPIRLLHRLRPKAWHRARGLLVPRITR